MSENLHGYIKVELPVFMLKIKKRITYIIEQGRLRIKMGSDSFSDRTNNITVYSNDELKDIDKIDLRIEEFFFRNSNNLWYAEIDIGKFKLSPTPYINLYIPYFRGITRLVLKSK